MELHFTYLEINPLVVTSTAVHVLDLASRLDQTAEYLCASKWGGVEFPPPFGRDAYAEVCVCLCNRLRHSCRALPRKLISLSLTPNQVHR